MPKATQDFDSVDFIIQAEGGQLDSYEFYDGLQKLIDSGLVWQLQGSWQRAARDAINAGLCTHPERED